MINWQFYIHSDPDILVGKPVVKFSSEVYLRQQAWSIFVSHLPRQLNPQNIYLGYCILRS